MKTPRQLYAKQCPPTRERVAGDVHGEKWQMQVWNQVAGSDAKYEMDMTPSDTIQKTMNATEMTSQKLRDTINNTIAR